MLKLPAAASLAALVTAGTLASAGSLPQDAGILQFPLRSLPHSIRQLTAALQLERDGQQASLIQVSQAHGVETQRFQIYQDGLEVVGAQALAHRHASGLDLKRPPSRIHIAAQPGFGPDTATHLALATAGKTSSGRLAAPPALKILPEGKGSGRLIYWVTLSPGALSEGRDLVFDARSGTLIADISHRLEITSDPSEPPAPVTNRVRAANEICQIISVDTGFPLRIAAGDCPTAVLDGKPESGASESAMRASKNAADVIGYFENLHGRRSFDGKGSELLSLVHVGSKFANAFWDSDARFMGYGDGDGVVLGDLTLSLDVAGHEMTHGVTSSTSQLIYMDESGALNEAFSDFFGVAIAARARGSAPDWAIGKEIFLNEKREEGLRNLKDPASLMARYLTEEGNFEKRPYPSKVSEKFESFGPCDRRNDRCYVHVNSMIPARAMVLISDVLGMEQAEKLIYLVLTQFMTPMSQFDDFESQTMAACRATLQEEDCLKVRQALSEVGF